MTSVAPSMPHAARVTAEHEVNLPIPRSLLNSSQAGSSGSLSRCIMWRPAPDCLTSGCDRFAAAGYQPRFAVVGCQPRLVVTVHMCQGGAGVLM